MQMDFLIGIFDQLQDNEICNGETIETLISFLNAYINPSVQLQSLKCLNCLCETNWGGCYILRKGLVSVINQYNFLIFFLCV
jgi:hypothetical protein